uniref:G-protein coupled receptors family 1 profile domain-containing protein n=1 Tax=Neolamprologus brichardi TaxID=32507 RepID=A0A3Q4HSE4_NEOBR
MDEELNVTYITFDGHIFLFFIMFTLYILITCSNSIIIYLILIHKNLHEPMDTFIAALLLNVAIYATAIYPKLLIDFLSEKQIISYSACLFQFFIIYSLGCSEFVLLAAIAYDRYMAICKPLQYPTIMRKSTVSIFLEWLKVNCCVRSRLVTVFGIICYFDFVILPRLFIVFTYTKIFIVSYHSRKEIKKKAAETCLPHILVLMSFSCLGVYDVTISRVESDFPKTARFIVSLQLALYQPLFNPLIYGLKMKEISKHLKRLFCPIKFF